MKPVGQLSGLGEGQQIYSVRFIGDGGYVVTFRRVDPLYTLDLSSPTAPRVAGQLELEGYSSYLQPVGAGLLLGVGQEVGPENEPSGAQARAVRCIQPRRSAAARACLARRGLDIRGAVRPPRAPVLASHRPGGTAPHDLPAGGSGARPVARSGAHEQPEPGLHPAAGARGTFTGAVAFHIDSSGITELGRISHEPQDGSTPQIERSLVIGPDLFTLSSEGIEVSSVATLAREGFVGFPSPASAGSGSSSSSPGAPAG